MLAQRQREMLSNHLRQKQQQHVQQAQQQQRSIAMRAQGLNLPPNMAAGLSNPRNPQAAPQQFPYPPSYGTSTGLASSPPPTSPFSSPLSPGLPSLPPNPQLHLHGTSSSSSTSSSSQMMMGNTNMMGGQYGAVLSPQMQHSAFQYPNSGTAPHPSRLPTPHFEWECCVWVCVCVDVNQLHFVPSCWFQTAGLEIHPLKMTVVINWVILSCILYSVNLQVIPWLCVFYSTRWSQRAIHQPNCLPVWTCILWIVWSIFIYQHLK